MLIGLLMLLLCLSQNKMSVGLLFRNSSPTSILTSMPTPGASFINRSEVIHAKVAIHHNKRFLGSVRKSKNGQYYG